jgi:hypothetical protein
MKSLTTAVTLIVVERATGRGLFPSMILPVLRRDPTASHAVDLSVMLLEKRGETDLFSLLHSRGGATSLLNFSRFRHLPRNDDVAPAEAREFSAEELADEAAMKEVATGTITGLSGVLVKEGLFNDTPAPLLTVPEAVLHRIHRRATAAGIVVVIKHPEGVSIRCHCV